MSALRLVFRGVNQDMAKAEPNVVPLCDVLLVLLIIFMVITPMVWKGHDVRCPKWPARRFGRPAGRPDRLHPEQGSDGQHQQ